MKVPLVSIICLCHNQNKFVLKTLDSVYAQSYGNIEVIVVDDGSVDGSKETIRSYLRNYPNVAFMDIDDNIGNTAAFNMGLKIATGSYVIDLACDDLLNGDRVERQVAFFENQNQEVGVIYSDALYVNENYKILKHHFRDSKLSPHEGDVYSTIIHEYFVPPPTMMIRKAVFDELHGYDDTLAYEDFDFWVRSARNWKYAYQDEVLTQIVKHPHSHSTNWYKKEDKQLDSTYRICLKIRSMNKTAEEDWSLVRRLKFEIRQSVFSGNHQLAVSFGNILYSMGKMDLKHQLFLLLNKLHLDLSAIRKLYHKIRYDSYYQT